MRNKHITLVAGTEHTKTALVNQLKEYISDMVTIKSYAIDEGIGEVIKDQLVLLTSQLVKKELLELNLLDTSCQIVVANRTISYDHIDQVVLLPKGTKVLFVNDVYPTTHEGINTLVDLGIDYLEFFPYYPGIQEGDEYKDIKVAVTPGEIDKVPAYIEKVYDIGPRLMDFTTITTILSKLDILEYEAGHFSQRYLQKIIGMAKRLAHSTNEITKLNQHLAMVIDSLNDGLLVYDVKGQISVFNENLKKLLNVGNSQTIERGLKDIIYNKSLLAFLMDNEAYQSKVFDLDGTEVLVNKFQIPGSTSVIATFKKAREAIESNERLKRELINKGFYAKYTFDDIVGNSKKIRRVKEVCKKLANTDLTILIEGESGTGKELFASAIHNESKRRKGPFLAVNFSALPDELLESELFGYEEGAFTGAKKGGKAGLFEQADGGTIFLDEIGDVSMKVQARLLRVLQEKEIMRVGGSEIKTIDVRIIAATNKDLLSLVNKRSFREDLYYRLKMGYVKLFPLRERKEDVIQLLHYFMNIETREKIIIADEVIEKLFKYDWYGNVRELKNTISYILAVKENHHITLNDLPPISFFQHKEENKENHLQKAIDVALDPEELFILKKIDDLCKVGEIVGRDKLSDETKGTEHQMTSYQMRTRLNRLERKGFTLKERGKRGTVLSQQGKDALMALMVKRNG
ncbi:sigma-54 interaction domain-containing protein [Alkaliphilus serpentinus]|uniref:AAA family ATPase n=1 Tax=Alkaliphilus serpentinus TaxID=1482731 RepID=A0A833HQK2_9FIRM|nr:sigma 54-interacting transcriptional regulator [Alkaliphilus serpentinus]KAB3531122.1 AAA family ATPase [Alkaliphilus serpentinus]